VYAAPQRRLDRLGDSPFLDRLRMNFGLADARAALADETAPENCDPTCRSRTRD
jgi:hypothetical protein